MCTINFCPGAGDKNFRARIFVDSNSSGLGDGEGIHWPEIDEDLSVMGLLRGNH
ncbi:MAG: DUF2442 domain-containing protein [Gammaproteobacteria bacterium]|nr:DUF2442 domain-containing protein [Gammaproteobacteria bacterium]